ncbi:hypothetical protein LCGC14_1337890 [marine sediment metagenome]|uniref:Uncharacterized protein n=1 Tax=marine sediment metagenome TaxID=412755 RepID=A0A0F9KEE6_9ZZZZ
MSENAKIINPADIPQIDKVKSVGIGKIEGKEVFITGYNHTRGQPNDYTRPDQISQEDGKTDYWTIVTKESFDLPPKKGEPEEPINGFFVTEAIGKQIERIPNYAEALSAGGQIGPVKAIKRQSKRNPTQTYWCLAFENDEDYK